jgi:hypothetical protein
MDILLIIADLIYVIELLNLDLCIVPLVIQNEEEVYDYIIIINNLIIQDSN